MKLKRLQSGFGTEWISLRNVAWVYVRRGIAAHVSSALERWGSELPSGSTVLDVGCGTQPYRPWVEESGLSYRGIDWTESPGASGTLVHNLIQFPWPLPAASFDAMICTEVIEHIPEPELFLRECLRVLKPGGRVLLTTPFVWPEHLTPYDYFRYSRYGLRHLFAKAGFSVLTVEGRGGWPLTMAQLLAIWSWKGFPRGINIVTRLLMMPICALLAACDRGPKEEEIAMSLGFTVEARVPS